MTIPRFLLAVLLSIAITFAFVAGYVLYPLIALLLNRAAREPETSGVAFVVSGVRSSTLLITEVVVFAIVFGLLSRRRVG
jgi:hypothetical protein